MTRSIGNYSLGPQDEDIANFLDQLPPGEKSAMVRQALRLLMQQEQRETGELALLREAVEALRVEVRRLREGMEK